jgi:hypothetical protein
VNLFDFSDNHEFFKQILNIPSLEDFRIQENLMGRKEIEYLCEFLEENRSLKTLHFDSNATFIKYRPSD